MSHDLRDVILKALAQQRSELMLNPISDVGDVVLGDQDILDESLSSLGLTVEDINPDEYRDYQNETIMLVESAS